VLFGPRGDLSGLGEMRNQAKMNSSRRPDDGQKKLPDCLSHKKARCPTP
jgi:hypothetical protein